MWWAQKQVELYNWNSGNPPVGRSSHTRPPPIENKSPNNRKRRNIPQIPMVYHHSPYEKLPFEDIRSHPNLETHEQSLERWDSCWNLGVNWVPNSGLVSRSKDQWSNAQPTNIGISPSDSGRLNKTNCTYVHTCIDIYIYINKYHMYIYIYSHMYIIMYFRMHIREK